MKFGNAKSSSGAAVRGRLLLLGVSTFTLLGLGSTPAHAQTAAEPEPQVDGSTGLNDIVVTAQRRATNVQDTPLAVSAFDESRIADSGLSDLRDLSQIAPGVSFVPAIANQNFLSMRGAVTGLVAPGTDQAASLFLDDVLIVGASGLDRELFDLDRVEVLRGPQGTLFGRNVTGGAILLYTKKPQFDFNAGGRGTLGSYDRAEFSGYVTGPIAGDKLAALISADVGHYDGDYENVIRGGRDEEQNNFRTRASLLFRPQDTLSMQLTGYYTKEKRGHAPLFNTGGNVRGNPFSASLLTPLISRAGEKTVAAYDGESDAEEYMVVGRADWETGIGTITNITAYRERTIDITTDGTFSSTVSFPGTTSTYDRTFSQELRIASPAENRLRLVAGAYYLNQRGRTHAYTDVNVIPGSSFGTSLVPTGFSTVARPGCAPVAPGFFLCDFQRLFVADGTGGPNQYRASTSQAVDTESVAAFGEVTFDVTDRLSLIVGGRYTVDQRDGTTSKSPGSGTINNPAVNNLVGLVLPNRLYYPGFTAFYKKTWKDFTPKASLTYKPTDDILLFATYSEGFRSGGFSTEGQTAASSAIPLDPETAINYELGIKSRWLDNRLQINASGFYVTYKNLQSRAFNNSINAYVSSNVGDVDVYGVELETLFQVTDNLLLGANYAYSGGKVTRDTQDPAPDSASTIQDESLPVLGAKPVGLPTHKLTVFGTYELPLANDGAIKLNADATFGSKYYGLRNNSDPDFIYNQTENKGVVNASISYLTPDRRWELKAFVRNLTDERHIVSGSAELSSLLLTSAEIASGSGVFGTIYNPPRTFGGTVTFRFN